MALTERKALQIFYESNAIIYGHFVYASGKHGAVYVNKDAIYPRPNDTSLLCRAIAEQFANDNVEAVIAPAIGGVILSQWTAYHLSNMTDHKVLGVYAEKSADKVDKEVDSFVIKRGYDKLIAGKNVLVVEDILNTGGSVRKVIEATRDNGGKIAGLAVLWNRGEIELRDMPDIPKFAALINVKFEKWDKSDCLLCKRGDPINQDFGKGRTLSKM